MAGASGEHCRRSGSRPYRDDPPILEYPGRAMTEHSNDRPPPAVLPASKSPLPSPLAKLADIPEEEIWLAKQKSKRTRRAYKLDVQHFMRTLHITTYEELRKVDHRAVIAWERIMREIDEAEPSTIRRRLAALSESVQAPCSPWSCQDQSCRRGRAPRDQPPGRLDIGLLQGGRR